MNFLQQIPKRILIIAASLFLLESLLVISASIPWLLSRVNADDFYYYLTLARNSAAGYGPTFDGVELTNGFHPLYLIFITILAKLPVTQPDFLIKSSLILLLLFHNGTGVLIGTSFKLRNQPDVGLVITIAWLVNPWALAITLHGVEAPIATFLWTVVIFGLIFYRAEVAPDHKKAAWLGVATALAILARTDGLLLLGATLTTELYRAWRRPAWRLQIATGVIIIGGVALLITLPWWWWNWRTFDMIIQVSGKAIFLGTHGFDWFNLPVILAKVLPIGLGYLSRIILYNLIPLLLIGLAFWLHKKQQPGQFRLGRLLKELDFALLAVIALALWYIGWQWSVQNWYLLSTTVVMTIGAGFIWQQLLPQQRSADIKFAVGLVIFLSSLILTGVYLTTGFGFPRQERGYQIAQWLNQNAEPNAIVGAWNSGIIGYFTQRRVVNLDGVVNNSLYHYKVARRTTDVVGLMDYIKGRQINYLTDYEHFYINNPQEIGLQLAHEDSGNRFRVYRLE